MGLLQELPSSEQLTLILAPVVGDETAGTGVAGVLKLLEAIDPSTQSISLSTELNRSVSENIAVDTNALTGGVLYQFHQVITSIPDDPSTLIEPLTTKLASIKNLSSAHLSDQLLAGVNGLQKIESLVPADTSSLVTVAAEGLTQLKGEFITGAFGDLKQWSQSVQTLYAEIEPLLAGGAGTVEERLISYLQEKITDLVNSILPQQGLLAKILPSLDAALSTAQLTEIDTLKGALIKQMNQARIEFESGNFTNVPQLSAAQQSFQNLTSILADIVNGLSTVLDQEIATADGLASALQKQFNEFLATEITDLGNIKEKFTGAINRIQEVIEGLDLDRVRETIEGVFEKINNVIRQFELRKFTAKLSDLQGQIQSVLETLDAMLFEAIASIRNVFTQIKETLRSVALTLGSYNESGHFQFHIQQELENFLNGLKATLQENIQPLLNGFKTLIRQTLQQVKSNLNAVKGEIGGVKTQLQNLLEGVNEQLQSLDVAGTMAAICQQLDEMLNGLSIVDFDPIIDPVVAQIHEMRDALKKIDVSSLNELMLGALKVSVEVVVAISFSTQITDALMAEMDELLETPRRVLNEIEINVENAFKEFGKLEPAALLSPLDHLFKSVSTHLDAFSMDALLKPLDEWYEYLQSELDKVSLTSILQPLIDLYAELQNTFDSISPVELIRPLQIVIDSVKTEIQTLDIAGLVTELSRGIDQVKGLLNDISPEPLLSPLVNAFDKIMGSLGNFEPNVLLEPFTAIFDALTEPLNNLNADHVQLIRDAFAVLHELLDAFDPQYVLQTVQGKCEAVQTLLLQLNVGQLIAELKTPYDAMNASFVAQGGSAHPSLGVVVEGLNPLRDPSIGAAATNFPHFQNQLSALVQAGFPGELASQYDNTIKPKLDSLIPTWSKDNISAASIRRAFEVLNPLNIAAEINQFYEAMKQQIATFDPRIIQENIATSFETIKETIFGFDPEEIADVVQGMIDSLQQQLDVLDLQLIAEELEGGAEEIAVIIDGINPQIIIEQLQGVLEEVVRLAETLQPRQILGELNTLLQSVKEIILEFNPVGFMEPIQEIFEEIQSLLEGIDIGLILQPLTERLEQLRDELEVGLKRTETAFNEMLQAVPV